MRVVIIGAGQVGRAIAERLTQEGQSVVLVDTHAERLAEVANRIDVGTVQGTGCSPVVLKRAGMDRAGMVIAVTDSDEVNLLACLVASRLGSKIVRIARVRDPEYHDDPELFLSEPFGLKAVINPEEEAARRLAYTLCVPGATDVVGLASGQVLLACIRIEQSSPLAGRTLASIDPGKGRMMRVAAIDRRGHLTIPRGADRIEAGDLAYFVCLRENAGDVLRLVGKRPDPVRSVLVYGAGDLATYLALELGKAGIAVKVMASEADQCARCAELVPDAIVVQGEATDSEVLEDEGIADMDAFVACSGNDERNLTTALLARSLGARLVMLATATPLYETLAPSIGIDTAISLQSSIVGKILQHLRQGRVLGVQSLLSREAEVIELQAVQGSKLVSVPLRYAGFPKGTLALTVSHGGTTTIATGETVIEHGDRVVVMTLRQTIEKLERIISTRSDAGEP